jgi:hypothetical protein
MKKLSNVEMSVLSNEISKKINDEKYEKIKGKLEKDVDYKKLIKLSKECSDLRKKLDEKMKLNSELVLKVRNKFNISNVYVDNDNEIRCNFGGVNVYNDIVLNMIGKEFNIDDMINKIVDKYVNK